MAYHERDIAEAIDALSQRYRDGEFSEDVYRASLIQFMPRDEMDEMVRRDTAIRFQFAGSNARYRPPQAASDIKTVIDSINR